VKDISVVLDHPEKKAAYSFVPGGSPVHIGLRRAHRSSHKFSFRVCVECLTTLILGWLWTTSKFCFGLSVNSVWRSSWVWSPLPGAVVPCLRLWLGLAPRYQEGTLFGMYGQVITEPVDEVWFAYFIICV
jgi:hypothetical protein